MKTEIAVKIVTFYVNLLKNGKDTLFLPPEMKNSTIINENLRTLQVFIQF
jgi:hypothetical protein